MSEEVLEVSKEDEHGQQTKIACNLLEVYDEEGNIKCGEEAINVWRDHFARVLGGNDGVSSDDVSSGGVQGGLNFSERLCQPISREEVRWALDK
jgi:hypothetical protein